jgi:hypothetical protein
LVVSPQWSISKKNLQKSVAVLGDIPESDLVSNDDFALTRTNAGSGVVGWIDGF